MDRALGSFPHRILEAAPLFVLGLFKKVVLADRLSLLVEPVYTDPAAHGIIDIVLATLGFAGQIYCDFSGYTDMALACAALFGFRLPDNFRSPFLATGPQDFWRRWHISLSTWLRDYLYIPLGGSRHGLTRTCLALGATMLLGGLWHGAAWTFVCWGAYHGGLLTGERILRARAPRVAAALAPIGTALFFPLTLLGWMIFRADSLESLGLLFTGLTRLDPVTVAAGWLALALALIFAEQVISEWSRRRELRWADHPYLSFGLAGIGLLLSAVLQPMTREPFIYFQF
jgi:D-alanyl-lipoteichoic acid acyltransferase DltB (MBOAT superfamily)